jgi:cytosine/adenosine deaminase-related metal-dependent hydrolase
VDVESGSVLPEGTCLTVEGGKISSIDDHAPSGETLDLGGRCVVPGLFNTHFHMHLITSSLMMDWGEWRRLRKHRHDQIERALADCLERGITVIQDGLPDELSLNRKLAARIESGRLTGPRIHQPVHVTPEGGAFAPRRSFSGRMMRSMMGLTNIDYGDPDSGVLVFSPDASPQQVRDAVDRAVDERGAGSTTSASGA